MGSNSGRSKSTRVAKVRQIRPTPDPKLVEALEGWLTEAKSGELIGAVIIGNRRGNDVQHQWVGTMPLSVAMVTFEQFKLKALGVVRDD